MKVNSLDAKIEFTFAEIGGEKVWASSKVDNFV